jgi:CopG family transcriptional regulator/antitoxin EndoAI
MTAKVMISLPEPFLEEIDRQAKAEHRSRSEFLREAVRFYLRAQEGRLPPGQLPQVQRAVDIQDHLAEAMADSEVDSVEVLRTWRERRR